MSRVTELFHRSINMTIDWHYTMALVSRFPIKTHRRLLACATTMRLRFFMKGDVMQQWCLATLNSNNSVVYGQKHKVWVLVFLVRTSGTF